MLKLEAKRKLLQQGRYWDNGNFEKIHLKFETSNSLLDYFVT